MSDQLIPLADVLRLCDRYENESWYSPSEFVLDLRKLAQNNYSSLDEQATLNALKSKSNKRDGNQENTHSPQNKTQDEQGSPSSNVTLTAKGVSDCDKPADTNFKCNKNFVIREDTNGR